MSKTVDERIKKLERQLEKLKAEREAEKKPEFPYFAEFPSGEVAFFESADGEAYGAKCGKGWSMGNDIYYFGKRSDTWNIDISKPFTGTLKIVDGKVVSKV
jgi:hypothetical protein